MGPQFLDGMYKGYVRIPDSRSMRRAGGLNCRYILSKVILQAFSVLSFCTPGFHVSKSTRHASHGRRSFSEGSIGTIKVPH